MQEKKVNVCDTVELKCESCGADLVFEPNLGMLKCAHCGSTKEIVKHVNYTEKDFFSAVKDDNGWTDEAISYKCENCGALTVMNKGEIAGKCPFCGAAKVVSVKDQAGIKPMAVIPFAFGRDKAREFYLKWIKRRIFAPSALKKSFSADKVNNVYVPCWVYDAESISYYEGRLGKYYTVTTGSGKNRRTERRIRWYHVSGNYDRYFDDIAIEASDRINQKELDAIMPYDTKTAYEYDSGYLAGAVAERYRIGVADGFDIARARIDAVIKNEILSKHNADVVGYLNINTRFNEVRYKYVLLPIWLCCYNYKNKVYNFLVNGSTGKTSGKTPVSVIKAGIAAIIGLGVIVLVIKFLMDIGFFA